MTEQHTDNVVTSKEIMQELGISKAQVTRLFNGLVRGVSPLPYVKVGTRKRVTTRKALDKWKRENSNDTGERVQ